MSATLVSMEMDDEHKYDAPDIEGIKPDFPFGLRICLTQNETEKLGIDAADAKYDAVFSGRFVARILYASTGEGPEGKCCRIEAQIEHLAIDGLDDDDD